MHDYQQIEFKLVPYQYLIQIYMQLKEQPRRVYLNASIVMMSAKSVYEQMRYSILQTRLK